MSLSFNSDPDSQDIVSETLRITGVTTNVYPVADITRRVNAALDRFVYLAATANGTWQFDDSLNTSDLPIGVTNLLSGQQDYSFASEVLLVEKVFAKDATGVWNELTPTDVNRDSRTTAQDIYTTMSPGTPTHYEKLGNSLLLSPVPNYNQSSGLKVVFQRGPNYFEPDDTTKRPGIPTIFHNYLPRYAALLFLVEEDKAAQRGIAGLIANDERMIQNYYAFRGKDVRPRLTISQENNR